MPILPASYNDTDISRLVSLVNSAFSGDGGQAGWTHESHLLEGPRINAERMALLLQDPGSVILLYLDEQGGALTGCVYLQKKGHTLNLGMLSVWPLRQGTGIGKELLAAAEAHALRLACNRIRINVFSLRTELIAWYERHGYRQTGETEIFHLAEKIGVEKRPLEMTILEKVI